MSRYRDPQLQVGKNWDPRPGCKSGEKGVSDSDEPKGEKDEVSLSVMFIRRGGGGVIEVPDHIR